MHGWSPHPPCNRKLHFPVRVLCVLLALHIPSRWRKIKSIKKRPPCFPRASSGGLVAALRVTSRSLVCATSACEVSSLARCHYLCFSPFGYSSVRGRTSALRSCRQQDFPSIHRFYFLFSVTDLCREYIGSCLLVRPPHSKAPQGFVATRRAAAAATLWATRRWLSPNRSSKTIRWIAITTNINHNRFTICSLAARCVFYTRAHSADATPSIGF